MNDDNTKFGKPRGPKRPGGSGPRGGAGEKRFGGKPGGSKPYAKSAGATGDRPFRKGPPREAGADGEAKPFREKRPNTGEKRPYSGEKRDFAPRWASGDRPFRKGPPRDAGADGEAKPFREKRPYTGEKRPYSGEKRDFAPRAASGDRPFRKGPPRDAGADSEAKPFREKRPYTGEKRPYSGEKRDFAPRGASGERPFRKAPPREAGAEGETRSEFKPRSFGSKRHASAESTDRPRSYGMKQHDRPSQGGERGRVASADAAEESGERIAKRLARAGIASRREAEDLVTSGRVRVNGHLLTSPATNVSPDDRIELDGTEIPPIERTRLFLFHKPAGVVTTNRDPEGRKTVFDVLPEGLPRLMTVGRLDINTEGLLLLTNDGGLSRVLELPTTGWLRRYRVRVHGDVDEKALADLRDGVAVDGIFYGAIEASLERTQGTNAWLSIGLREGKNREVKNVLGSLGLEVTRLIRVSFGPFQLGEIPEGEVQEIKGRTLRDQLGERLIEDSGANFEAPIMKPFSNKAEQVRREEPREHPQQERPRRPMAVEGEGGLIKNRKRQREDRRDDALGRLSTRPERSPRFEDKRGAKPFGKPRGKDGERESKPIDPPGQRRANIWMAPGARPQGAKSDPDKGSSPKPRTRSDGPRGGDRPRGPRKG